LARAELRVDVLGKLVHQGSRLARRREAHVEEPLTHVLVTEDEPGAAVNVRPINGGFLAHRAGRGVRIAHEFKGYLPKFQLEVGEPWASVRMPAARVSAVNDSPASMRMSSSTDRLSVTSRRKRSASRSSNLATTTPVAPKPSATAARSEILEGNDG